MPVVIPPGFFQLSFIHHSPVVGGSDPTWTIGVQGEPTAESVGPLLAWLDDNYATVLNEEYEVTGVRLATADGSTIIPLSVTGTSTGDPAPPNASVLVHKTTGTPGRTNQGRMYWPGCVGHSDVGGNGLIGSSRFLTLGEVAADLNDAFTTASLVPVILHSASSDPTAIGGFDVERKIATQRRRLRT